MQDSDLETQNKKRRNRTERNQDTDQITTDNQQSDTDESRTSSFKSGRKIQFKKSQIVITHKGPKKFSWPIYKKLVKYARKEWKLFVISISFLIFSSLITSSIPYVIGQLLDTISKIASADPDVQPQVGDSTLSKYHLYFIVTLTLLALSTFFRTITMQLFQQRIGINLRIDVFGNFIKNDMFFFETHKSGELNSRVGNDVNQAKQALGRNVTSFLRSSISVITNICILMSMSWRLSMLMLSLAPFYYLSTRLHNSKIKNLAKQYQNVQAESAAHLNQVFTGIQIVKAFATEEKQIDKYYEIQSKAYSINYLKAMYGGLYFTASTFLPNIGILMILWYGGSLVLQQNATLKLGELTSFIMYCKTLSRQISMISNGYNGIVTSTASVQKLFSMMDYKPFIDEKQVKKVPNYDLKGQIEFKNVCFKYPKGYVQVIRNLNFKISSGEYVAFVGRSGSGKSTIVKLIQRFYQIQSGTLSFDGIDSKNMKIKNIRDQIGFVSQEALLFSGSIEQNITYGVKDYSYEEMIKVCQQSGCIEFILNEKLFPHGFKTIVGEKGNQLSGGQRQRISIARALMRKPKILIFDEATSALDANSQHIVQQSIENLVSAEREITIIVIAHRLSTVIRAQKIYVMKGGQIVQTGQHESLIDQKGYYFELISKQIQSNVALASMEVITSLTSIEPAKSEAETQ